MWLVRRCRARMYLLDTCPAMRRGGRYQKRVSGPLMDRRHSLPSGSTSTSRCRPSSTRSCPTTGWASRAPSCVRGSKPRARSRAGALRGRPGPAMPTGTAKPSTPRASIVIVTASLGDGAGRDTPILPGGRRREEPDQGGHTCTPAPRRLRGSGPTTACSSWRARLRIWPAASRFRRRTVRGKSVHAKGVHSDSDSLPVESPRRYNTGPGGRYEEATSEPNATQRIRLCPTPGLSHWRVALSVPTVRCRSSRQCCPDSTSVPHETRAVPRR
jgi:hypothetical protein